MFVNQPLLLLCILRHYFMYYLCFLMARNATAIKSEVQEPVGLKV